MSKVIPLSWAIKFRQLYNDEDMTHEEIINNFLVYCREQEKALVKRWKEKENE